MNTVNKIVPFDTVKLPSNGIVYDESNPLCNETEVAIRGMGALQENILNSEALKKKGTISSVLIKSCLANPNIDVSSLLLGDKAALLLAIRISGLGHEYKVMTRCPSCGHTFKYTFDLRKCPIRRLKVEPLRKNTNLFDFVLPVLRKTVTFKLLTDLDDLELANMQKAKAKQNSDIDSSTTDRLLQQIVAIEGNESREFISEFVFGPMKSLDIKSLVDYIEDIAPGMDLEEEVKCPKCDDTDLHKVPMVNEFFRPKTR
jgi:uncharacterized C2H2 Zn-finger protein